MTDTLRLWMRHEVRPTERRAPIVPVDARRLVEDGIAVTVEDSPQRVFPISDYAAAGCRIAEPGSWVGAPDDAYIIGLKELPEAPAALVHRHVFFGHTYKGQDGAGRLLPRFAVGGGTLLDLEYPVDAEGQRLAAFGYWAGYVGVALAVLHHSGRLSAPLQPLSKDSLDAALDQSRGGRHPGHWSSVHTGDVGAARGKRSPPPASRRPAAAPEVAGQLGATLATLPANVPHGLRRRRTRCRALPAGRWEGD